MSLDLRSLIGKLNNDLPARARGRRRGCASRARTTRSSSSTGCTSCSRIRPDDVTRILRHFAIQPDRFSRNLENARSTGCKSGNSRQPALSPTIELLAREGWVQSSINFEQARVRSGALLLAALSDARLRRQLIDIDGDIRNVNVESCSCGSCRSSGGSSEDQEGAAMDGPPERELAEPGAKGAGSKAPGARPVHRRSHGERARPARSTRCSAATSRSARSSTS